MAEPSNGNRARYPTIALLVTSAIGLLLVLLSFLIRVRIVVEQPAVGDVTGFVQTFWRVLVGLATVGSFGSAVYDVVGGFELRGMSSTRVEVSGDDNDVDLHLHGPGPIGRSDLVAVEETDPAGSKLPQFPSEPGGNGAPDDDVLEDP